MKQALHVSIFIACFLMIGVLFLGIFVVLVLMLLSIEEKLIKLIGKKSTIM
jgi:hypothetical protein